MNFPLAIITCVFGAIILVASPANCWPHFDDTMNEIVDQALIIMHNTIIKFNKFDGITLPGTDFTVSKGFLTLHCKCNPGRLINMRGFGRRGDSRFTFYGKTVSIEMGVGLDSADIVYDHCSMSSKPFYPSERPSTAGVTVHNALAKIRVTYTLGDPSCRIANLYITAKKFTIRHNNPGLIDKLPNWFYDWYLDFSRRSILKFTTDRVEALLNSKCNNIFKFHFHLPTLSSILPHWLG